MAESNYHVLLIGIDAYSKKPLRGCVNDIDALEQLLLTRVGVPAADVTRLASPHPEEKHVTQLPSLPATRANIRAAFEKLGSGAVGRDDRVFIYYSGHGSRVPITSPQGNFDREGLVPVDFNAVEPPTFLFDYELNELLAAITKRTPNVAFILDCCHSTGATRDTLHAESTSRVLDWWQDLGRVARLALPIDIGGERGLVSGAGPSQNLDDCQVVAACLNHELAQESVGDDGIRHGLFTRALLEQLGAASGDLATLPWAWIWQGVRARVTALNDNQHPWMAGHDGRAWLAGPPVERDAGFPVTRGADASYLVGAGTLVGLTERAVVAVYAGTPPFFPPLDSSEGQVGKIVITSASPSSSVGTPQGPAFDLPPGARARLVEPGLEERLRCAVVPTDAAIGAQIQSSKLLELAPADRAQVRLERCDGGYALTDDLYGAKPAFPALFRLEEAALPSARRLFEHYHDYSRPLRMAARCTDLAGVLQVSLLAVPGSGVPAAQAQAPDAPEVEAKAGFPYALSFKQAFCVRVRNTSLERLRVTLLNCAASGKVEFIGDQEIDARKQYVFWLSNEQGRPFKASPRDNPYIDRLVAIGRTDLAAELQSLRVDRRFAEAVQPLRDVGTERDLGDADEGYQWTATHVPIAIGM